ncbi:MAG: sigma-54-dependent Fis family transcriptional regulator [Deltaproteobacteria bacterium]|nr:sigma-54-dependent Fis family transcriptional regulator [Deltaproteobacteria bacterium]
MLGAALESAGFACRFAADGEEAVRSATTTPPELLLLDVRMPRLDGIEALRRIAEELPALPVVIVTAHGDVRTAVEAMKLGARDFIEKPVDIDELRNVVQDILERPAPDKVDGGGETDEPRTLVGPSAAMAKVRQTVRLAAKSNATVLVHGESGTGKEVVARAIHDLSDRRTGPFVALNCAAVPEGLLESELFGHEKGAFTGAGARHAGRFEAAGGGTLLLDEIGEMRPPLQARLLRALQERSFERLGGTSPVHVDIRVVAATNRDLRADIAQKRFREDLYYRLAVVEIAMPPLRDRREDILPTAQHLLARLRPEARPRLTAEAAAGLTLHDWPGNVRELANVLERALLFAGTGDLAPEHLPPALRELCGREETPAGPPDATGVRPGVSLEAVERDLIEKTLRSLGGNRSRTAETLGLSRRALLYKLKRYGIR